MNRAPKDGGTSLKSLESPRIVLVAHRMLLVMRSCTGQEGRGGYDCFNGVILVSVDSVAMKVSKYESTGLGPAGNRVVDRWIRI